MWLRSRSIPTRRRLYRPSPFLIRKLSEPAGGLFWRAIHPLRSIHRKAARFIRGVRMRKRRAKPDALNSRRKNLNGLRRACGSERYRERQKAKGKRQNEEVSKSVLLLPSAFCLLPFHSVAEDRVRLVWSFEIGNLFRRDFDLEPLHGIGNMMRFGCSDDR